MRQRSDVDRAGLLISPWYSTGRPAFFSAGLSWSTACLSFSNACRSGQSVQQHSASVPLLVMIQSCNCNSWRSQQGAWMVYLNKGAETVFNNTFLRVKAACNFCSWCWLTLGGETRQRLLQQHLHACCHRHCQQYPMCRPRHTKKYKCGARGIRAEGFDRRALVVLLCST